MGFPISPPSRILERMKEIAVAAELHVAFGLDDPFKFRHERHRRTMRQERPGIAFRLVGIKLDEQNATVHTQSEVCWRMTVDVVVDLELPPEEDVSPASDPTGWNNLAGTAGAVVNLFLAEDSPLRLMVDDIVPGDVDPDEDSKPDDARLAMSVDVLYRTLWNDLNHLLSSEENGL